MDQDMEEKNLTKRDTAIFCSRLEAERFARMLLASYPNSTPSDEQGYTALIMGIFMQHPPDLVRKAVSLSGISYDTPKWLPSVGEIEKWFSNCNDRIAARIEHDARVAKQIEDTDAWLKLEPSESLRAKAKAWLDRTDPKAQQLSRQRPKALTEDEKKAALESAAEAGRKISGMKLLPETIMTINQQIDPQPERHEDFS